MKYIVCKNAEDAIKKCKNGLNTKHFQPPSNLPPKTSDLPPKTSKNLRTHLYMFPFVCKTKLILKKGPGRGVRKKRIFLFSIFFLELIFQELLSLSNKKIGYFFVKIFVKIL